MELRINGKRSRQNILSFVSDFPQHGLTSRWYARIGGMCWGLTVPRLLPSVPTYLIAGEDSR